MSDQHKQHDKEKAFLDWMEGKNAGEIEPDLTEDPMWQQRMQTAEYIAQQADMYPEQSVPQWNREATFDADKRAWWQWGGLPLLSLTCSIAAVFLVLFNVQLQFNDKGMLLTFGPQQAEVDQNQLNALLDSRMREFAAEQQLYLATFTKDLNKETNDQNMALANYILTTSRQERKEDMTEFFDYLNQQNEATQLSQNRRINQIERALQYKQTNYQESGMNTMPEESDATVEE
ncbi:hypothetical protein [Thalassotalea agarivorans]|uniref:Uncharacterized protein n=1 Tax=Thalassotalea agarivorans TaxID=349064 RepID=A0A1I0AFV4_THASX|nr:hypothetical protein [Thalassotalea agarivorans]SES93049.1 hypothetical protein SAMN05660429_00690 [Thalassotalea agarivorans]